MKLTTTLAAAIAFFASAIVPEAAHAAQWYRVSDDATMDVAPYHRACQRFADEKDPVTHVKENSPISTVSVESETHLPDGATVMTLIINGKRALFTTSVDSCHDAHVQSHPDIYARDKAAAAVVSTWYVIDLGNNDHFGTCNRLSDAFRGMKDPDQLHAVLTEGGHPLPITRQGKDVVYFQDDHHAAPPLIMASSKSLCDHVADELLKRRR